MGIGFLRLNPHASGKYKNHCLIQLGYKRITKKNQRVDLPYLTLTTNLAQALNSLITAINCLQINRTQRVL